MENESSWKNYGVSSCQSDKETCWRQKNLHFLEDHSYFICIAETIINGMGCTPKTQQCQVNPQCSTGVARKVIDTHRLETLTTHSKALDYAKARLASLICSLALSSSSLSIFLSPLSRSHSILVWSTGHEFSSSFCKFIQHHV